jgi:hypothetical protein
VRVADERIAERHTIFLQETFSGRQNTSLATVAIL